MSARVLARGATPLDPGQGKVRRIRDQARDGLSAAGVSLAGSLGVTGALWVLIRWLG
jgi:hypothetical protein